MKDFNLTVRPDYFNSGFQDPFFGLEDPKIYFNAQRESDILGSYVGRVGKIMGAETNSYKIPDVSDRGLLDPAAFSLRPPEQNTWERSRAMQYQMLFDKWNGIVFGQKGGMSEEILGMNPFKDISEVPTEIREAWQSQQDPNRNLNELSQEPNPEELRQLYLDSLLEDKPVGFWEGEATKFSRAFSDLFPALGSETPVDDDVVEFLQDPFMTADSFDAQKYIAEKYLDRNPILAAYLSQRGIFPEDFKQFKTVQAAEFFLKKAVMQQSLMDRVSTGDSVVLPMLIGLPDILVNDPDAYTIPIDIAIGAALGFGLTLANPGGAAAGAAIATTITAGKTAVRGAKRIGSAYKILKAAEVSKDIAFFQWSYNRNASLMRNFGILATVGAGQGLGSNFADQNQRIAFNAATGALPGINEDYSLSEALLATAFGATLGGSIGVGLGAIGKFAAGNARVVDTEPGRKTTNAAHKNAVTGKSLNPGEELADNLNQYRIKNQVFDTKEEVIDYLVANGISGEGIAAAAVKNPRELTRGRRVLKSIQKMLKTTEEVKARVDALPEGEVKAARLAELNKVVEDLNGLHAIEKVRSERIAKTRQKRTKNALTKRKRQLKKTKAIENRLKTRPTKQEVAESGEALKTQQAEQNKTSGEITDEALEVASGVTEAPKTGTRFETVAYQGTQVKGQEVAGIRAEGRVEDSEIAVFFSREDVADEKTASQQYGEEPGVPLGDVIESTVVMDNPLVINAGGNKVSQQQADTYIARAREEGNDGVIFTNSVEDGIGSDVYYLLDTTKITERRRRPGDPTKPSREEIDNEISLEAARRNTTPEMDAALDAAIDNMVRAVTTKIGKAKAKPKAIKKSLSSGWTKIRKRVASKSKVHAGLMDHLDQLEWSNLGKALIALIAEDLDLEKLPLEFVIEQFDPGVFGLKAKTQKNPRITYKSDDDGNIIGFKMDLSVYTRAGGNRANISRLVDIDNDQIIVRGGGGERAPLKSDSEEMVKMAFEEVRTFLHELGHVYSLNANPKLVGDILVSFGKLTDDQRESVIEMGLGSIWYAEELEGLDRAATIVERSRYFTGNPEEFIAEVFSIAVFNSRVTEDLVDSVIQIDMGFAEQLWAGIVSTAAQIRSVFKGIAQSMRDAETGEFAELYPLVDSLIKQTEGTMTGTNRPLREIVSWEDFEEAFPNHKIPPKVQEILRRQLARGTDPSGEDLQFLQLLSVAQTFDDLETGLLDLISISQVLDFDKFLEEKRLLFLSMNLTLFSSDISAENTILRLWAAFTVMESLPENKRLSSIIKNSWQRNIDKQNTRRPYPHKQSPEYPAWREELVETVVLDKYRDMSSFNEPVISYERWKAMRSTPPDGSSPKTVQDYLFNMARYFPNITAMHAGIVKRRVADMKISDDLKPYINDAIETILFRRIFTNEEVSTILNNSLETLGTRSKVFDTLAEAVVAEAKDIKTSGKKFYVELGSQKLFPEEDPATKIIDSAIEEDKTIGELFDVITTASPEEGQAVVNMLVDKIMILAKNAGIKIPEGKSFDGEILGRLGTMIMESQTLNSRLDEVEFGTPEFDEIAVKARPYNIRMSATNRETPDGVVRFLFALMEDDLRSAVKAEVEKPGAVSVTKVVDAAKAEKAAPKKKPKPVKERKTKPRILSREDERRLSPLKKTVNKALEEDITFGELLARIFDENNPDFNRNFADFLTAMTKMAKSAKVALRDKGNVDDLVMEMVNAVFIQVREGRTKGLIQFERKLSDRGNGDERSTMSGLFDIIKGKMSNQIKKETQDNRVLSFDLIQERSGNDFDNGDDAIRRMTDELSEEPIVAAGQEQFDILGVVANNPNKFGITQNQADTIKIIQEVSQPDSPNSKLTENYELEALWRLRNKKNLTESERAEYQAIVDKKVSRFVDNLPKEEADKIKARRKSLGSQWSKKKAAVLGTEDKPSDLSKTLLAWSQDTTRTLKEHVDEFLAPPKAPPKEALEVPELQEPNIGEMIIHAQDFAEASARLVEPPVLEPAARGVETESTQGARRSVNVPPVEGDTTGPWKVNNNDTIEPEIIGELNARDYYGTDTNLTKMDPPENPIEVTPEPKPKPKPKAGKKGKKTAGPTRDQDRAQIFDTLLTTLEDLGVSQDMLDGLRSSVKRLPIGKAIQKILGIFDDLGYDAVIVNNPNRRYMLSLRKAEPETKAPTPEPISIPGGRRGLHEKTEEAVESAKPVMPRDKPMVKELTAEEEIVHGILASKEFLRFIGVDPEVIAAIIKSGNLREVNVQEAITYALLESRDIMFGNIEIHGVASRDFFWDKYRALIARNEAEKTKPDGDVLTVDEIIDRAAKATREEGKFEKFQTPFKTTDFDLLQLRKKFGRVLPKSRQDIKRDQLDDHFDSEDQDKTHLMNQLSLVGKIFGGKAHEEDSFWRNITSSIANMTIYRRTQAEQLYGSMSNIMRKLVAWADSGRVMTHHIVAPNQHGIATWSLRSAQAKRAVAPLANAQLRFFRALRHNADQYQILNAMMRRIHTLEGRDPTADDIRKALNITDERQIKNILNHMTKVREEVVRLNTIMAELELSTGRRSIKDTDEAVVAEEARRETFWPMLINPDRLAKEDQVQVLEEMVRVRLLTLKATDDLDYATMVALGFVRASRDAVGVDHRVMGEVGETTLNAESLSKLTRIGTFELEAFNSRSLDILEDSWGEAGWHWFAVREGDTSVTVYQVPKSRSQLSSADLQKYRKALDGNTSDYIPEAVRSLEEGGFTTVHHAGMADMLSFKLKQGKYSDNVAGDAANTTVFSRFDPRFRRSAAVSTSKTFGFRYTNLTPEEMELSPMLKRIYESDPVKIYDMYVRGQMFELLVQQDLDRLLGYTGTTITDYMSYAQTRLKTELSRLLNTGEIDQAKFKKLEEDIELGMRRLREIYASHSGLLRSSDTSPETTTQAAMDFSIRSGSSGYGVAALTETLPILFKKNGINLPAMVLDVVKFTRYIIGDLRGRKGIEELQDTMFFLDAVSRHLGSRFLSEASYDVDVAANWWNRVVRSGQAAPDAEGSKIGKVFHGVGNILMEVGSLSQVTNYNRIQSLIKHKRRTRKYVIGPKGNRLEKFLVAWNAAKPEMDLLKNQGTAKADAKLASMFKKLARENGFGGNWEDAFYFVEYGITSPEQARALEYGLRGTSPNFHPNTLTERYWELRSNPDPDIDPEVYRDATQKYIGALESRVEEEDVAESRNFAKVTDPSSRSHMGRMWNGLMGFSKAFGIQRSRSAFKRSDRNWVFQTIILLGLSQMINDMIREYIRGREIDDIVNEVEQDPQGMFLTSLARIPLLGPATSFIAGPINNVIFGNEGSYVSFAMPFQSVGPSAMKQTFDSLVSIPEHIASGDTSELAAAGTKATFMDRFMNRGFTGLPIRMVEDQLDAEQYVGIKDYLDSIQGDPYPYKKRSRGKESDSTIFRSLISENPKEIKEYTPSQDPNRLNAYQVTDTQRLLDYLNKKKSQ